MSENKVTSADYPTLEMIEAGAKAAWSDFTGNDGSNECDPDTWPETRLYPNADQFRSAAKACFLAMLKIQRQMSKP